MPLTTSSLHDRLVVEAAALTLQRGWRALTLDDLAEQLDIAPAQVHAEFAGKDDLGRSLVLWELGEFLEAAIAGFDANPDDLVAAVQSACRQVLERAQTHSLLHALIAETEGGDHALLPLLTTRSQSIVAAAAVVIELRVKHYVTGVKPERLGNLVDIVVRLVLSYVVRPSGTPEEMAASISWIVKNLMRT